MPALTGLRTVLAILIMLFHFTPPHPNFLTPLLANAYVFVGFFFLISGFVLAYNYADRPILHLRSFMVARLSRVYPVYALVLVLSIPFLLEEWTAHSRSDFFLGMLLTPLGLQSWYPPLATFWNTVAWTVPAEFFLYLLFPFILLYLSRAESLLNTPLKLCAAVLVVWLVGLIPHTIYLLLNPDHVVGNADRFTYGYWIALVKYSPPSYIWTFTAGVLLARLHKMVEFAPRHRFWLAAVALAGLGFFFAFAVWRIPYVIIHGCLLLPLFAMLLLGLAGPNPLAAAFAWRPLVKIGEATLSLYLIHFNGFLLIHQYYLPERLHLAWADPWISYAVLVAVAIAILRLYEGPARRFVLRNFGNASYAKSR